MADPYSGYPRPGEAPARRPSYANVAAGSSRLANPSFSTLARVSQNQRPQLDRRQSSQRSMEDSRPGSSGMARRAGGVLGYADGLGCSMHDQHPPAFVPAYLKWNRHARRLKRDWDKHLQELREREPQQQGHAGKQPLSRSSSSVNLAKMQGGGHAGSGVHRGVAQDVIERMPPMHHRLHEDDGTHPLPSRWNEEDKLADMEILGDGTEVRFTGVTKTSDDAASIRTDHPIPRECGLYYFEVTVISRGKEGQIGVGFSGRKTPLTRLPGWEHESWAYHGDDGFVFTCSPSGKAYGPQFATQDVVGCGINFRTGNAFFTKNGVFLGES